MKSLFVKYDEIPWVEAIPGVRIKPIIVDKLGASIVELTKGVVTPPHEHEDEQIDFCLEGKLEIAIKDEKGERVEVFEKGMAFALEPHVAHGITALEDSVLLEMWAPADRLRKVSTIVSEAA
jgi:quercetin dioxygenase-like cupin family protein